MSKDLEARSTGLFNWLSRRRRPVQPAHTHADCLNCGAVLQGRYCHLCGQSVDDRHRSIVHLSWEAIEGFTHLDGRLAKTLPALLFKPGALARDYIEGRRTRHVPPFRLFLITLLIFMFALEARIHRAPSHGIRVVKVGFDGPAARPPHLTVSTPQRLLSASDLDRIDFSDSHSAVARWLNERIHRAIHNPELYMLVVFEWAHRLAVLMLPLLAAQLTALYAYKRRFYVYDHLIVSMQYLSFCFLLWAVVWVLPKQIGGWAILPGVLWSIGNLYLMLRGAYGSGRVGGAIRSVLLWVSTVALFGVLINALLLLALNQI